MCELRPATFMSRLCSGQVFWMWSLAYQIATVGVVRVLDINVELRPAVPRHLCRAFVLGKGLDMVVGLSSRHRASCHGSRHECRVTCCRIATFMSRFCFGQGFLIWPLAYQIATVRIVMVLDMNVELRTATFMSRFCSGEGSWILSLAYQIATVGLSGFST